MVRVVRDNTDHNDEWFHQWGNKKLLKSSHTAEVCASSHLLPYVDRTALVAAKKFLRLGTAYGGWIIPVDAGLTANSSGVRTGKVTENGAGTVAR
jgi:hypothetical protein